MLPQIFYPNRTSASGPQFTFLLRIRSLDSREFGMLALVYTDVLVLSKMCLLS